MIDGKTARSAASLILVMLVGALWRIITLGDGATLAAHGDAPLALLLFAFPAASALVVGCLYLNRHAADDAKSEPWRKWGKFLAISYCGGMLLLQGVLILASYRLDLSLDLAAIARTLGILLTIVSLLAINQMPKLPWLESRFSPGGELGPVYGPKYMRTLSRILVVFLMATIAFNVAAPRPGWHTTRYILLAATLLVVWSIAWRWYLGRKWRLERSGPSH